MKDLRDRNFLLEAAEFGNCDFLYNDEEHILVHTDIRDIGYKAASKT